MNLTIGKAKITDAPALFILNEKFNGKSNITVSQIQNSLENNNQEQVFVAKNEHTVIGFCCVQVFKSFCYHANYAEITELYVDEKYQRNGAGTKMLYYIEKHYESTEVEGFQLFTGGENYSAQRFYEKMGYLKTTEIMYRKRK